MDEKNASAKKNKKRASEGQAKKKKTQLGSRPQSKLLPSGRHDKIGSAKKTPGPLVAAVVLRSGRCERRILQVKLSIKFYGNGRAHLKFNAICGRYHCWTIAISTYKKTKKKLDCIGTYERVLLCTHSHLIGLMIPLH